MFGCLIQALMMPYHRRLEQRPIGHLYMADHADRGSPSSDTQSRQPERLTGKELSEISEL